MSEKRSVKCDYCGFVTEEKSFHTDSEWDRDFPGKDWVTVLFGEDSKLMCPRCYKLMKAALKTPKKEKKSR